MYDVATCAACFDVVITQERTGLEAQHTNKINAEINRYQAMVQEKEELSKKWDEEVLVHALHVPPSTKRSTSRAIYPVD